MITNPKAALRHAFLATFLAFTAISMTPGLSLAGMAPSMSSSPCPIGNTTWTVTTYCDDGSINNVTTMDCNGHTETFWPTSASINVGNIHVPNVQSVTFTPGTGSSWTINGNSATGVVYTVSMNATGVASIDNHGYIISHRSAKGDATFSGAVSPTENGMIASKITTIKVEPSASEMRVRFTLDSQSDVTIGVYDQLGNTMAMWSVQSSTGENVAIIPVTLAVGRNYFVRVVAANNVTTQKVAIVR